MGHRHHRLARVQLRPAGQGRGHPGLHLEERLATREPEAARIALDGRPLGLLGQVGELRARPLRRSRTRAGRGRCGPAGRAVRAMGWPSRRSARAGRRRRRPVPVLDRPARAAIRPATASAWAWPSLGEVESGGPAGQHLARRRRRAVADQEDHRGSVRRALVGWPRPFTVLGSQAAARPSRAPGRVRGAATRPTSGSGHDAGPWSRSSWDSRDGHQFHRPSSTTTDGTSRVRTKKVSSRMPAASPTPISTIWVLPVAVSTPKVPARIRPADVTVVPVASTARRTADPDGGVVGLLADPGHHQDVVVLAQRHDEDEHEEGQDEVDAVLAADDHEDQHGEARARPGRRGRRWPPGRAGRPGCAARWPAAGPARA